MIEWMGADVNGCGACNARADEMDRRGPDWCEQNTETILDWLAEGAARQGLPFLRFGAAAILREAIRRARAAKPTH